MAWKPSDRVELAKTDGFDGMPLTPEDFFLVSRLDAKPTLSELASGVGLPLAEVVAKVDRLIELGVARRARADVPTRGQRAGSARAKAASRLRAALGGVTGAVAAPGSTPPRASRPADSQAPLSRPRTTLRAEAGPGPNRAAPPSEISGTFDLAEPGTPIDPEMADSRDERIDPKLGISVELQRRVLGLADQLEHLNHFEILGITPTNDISDIRRAYHKLSRTLHPDAYYGKDIGQFKKMLQELFERARASHDLLVSSEKRDAYVDRLLEIERRKLASEAQKSRERDSRKARARMLERQKEEAIEAKRNAAAQVERAKRDDARKRKMSSRLMGREGRESKAKEHIRAGEAAVKENNYGAAAGLFRLAMDLIPENKEYHAKWEATLAEAQARRAAVAMAQAEQLIERGEEEEAGHYFEEAARAIPSALNQARSAVYLTYRDRTRAHARARGAMDAMKASVSDEDALSPQERGEVLLLCAEAFLRLGQANTAKVHAQDARKLIPKDPRVRVLLKKLKLS